MRPPGRHSSADWRTVRVSPSCPPRGLAASCCTWLLWVQSSAAFCRWHPWPRPRLRSRHRRSRSQRSGGRDSSPCLGASPPAAATSGPGRSSSSVRRATGTVSGSCTLRAGTSVLLPLINVECSSLEDAAVLRAQPWSTARLCEGACRSVHQPVPDDQRGRGQQSESASRPFAAVRVLTDCRQHLRPACRHRRFGVRRILGAHRSACPRGLRRRRQRYVSVRSNSPRTSAITCTSSDEFTSRRSVGAHSSLMTVAGTPATSVAGGTSRVTTAPAATTESAPMLTPGRIVAAVAIHTFGPIVIGSAVM